jgi:hypothetical protein
MARDVDTYLLDTSVGQVTVQWGWNKWVSINGRGLSACQAVISNRRGLEQLLVKGGIPEAEARPHAKRLWSDRPDGSLRRGEAEAWEGPWKQHPYGTLIGFVAAVLISVLFIAVFKFDWVGV